MDEQDRASNVEAYKEGLRSSVPASTPLSYSTTQPRPGQNDISFVGIEAHSHDTGLSHDSLRARLPQGNMSLREIFAEMAGVKPDALKRNVPGNTADYYYEIGQHEGGHVAARPGVMDGGLGNEIVGDKAAFNGDNPEVESALHDTRKISALIRPSHATSPALPDQPGGEPKQYNAIQMYAAARDLRGVVATDLIASGKMKEPGNLEDLQRDDPKAVYDSVKKLNDSGTFEGIAGSRGQYMRQYAADYLDASERWLKGIGLDPEQEQKAPEVTVEPTVPEPDELPPGPEPRPEITPNRGGPGL